MHILTLFSLISGILLALFLVPKPDGALHAEQNIRSNSSEHGWYQIIPTVYSPHYKTNIHVQL